jgi:hypothetical protein
MIPQETIEQIRQATDIVQLNGDVTILPCVPSIRKKHHPSMSPPIASFIIALDAAREVMPSLF